MCHKIFYAHPCGHKSFGWIEKCSKDCAPEDRQPPSSISEPRDCDKCING